MARPKKYKISLTDDELKMLKSVMHKKKTSKTVRNRCQIIIELLNSAAMLILIRHAENLMDAQKPTSSKQHAARLRKAIPAGRSGSWKNRQK